MVNVHIHHALAWWIPGFTPIEHPPDPPPPARRPPAASGTIGVRDKATGETGPSGLGGRSGGDFNIGEFTKRRWLTVNPGSAHYPY